ncbi:hypothetical protein C8J56DRAFT_784726 [Mycena floridula]|nr:hypothetical protein C8J56DRAFT_784726 [Mycena floridula]
MCGTASTLLFGRFWYHDLLLLVTRFQREYQECLAAWVSFRIFHDPPTKATTVHAEWMGIFTSNLDAAGTYFEYGVPVWVLRSPADVSKRMNVDSDCKIQKPVLCNEEWPGQSFPTLYEGGPSPKRIRACMLVAHDSGSLTNGISTPVSSVSSSAGSSKEWTNPSTKIPGKTFIYQS